MTCDTARASRLFDFTSEPQISQWQPIATAPEGVVVRTKISDTRGDRNDQMLKRQGRLWFVPDGSAYVYYTPTHWMPLNKGASSC